MSILANVFWENSSEIVPVEMYPPGSREHMEDLAALATTLTVVIQQAIEMLDADEPDAAREILANNLAFLDAATRVH